VERVAQVFARKRCSEPLFFGVVQTERYLFPPIFCPGYENLSLVTFYKLVLVICSKLELWKVWDTLNLGFPSILIRNKISHL